MWRAGAGGVIAHAMVTLGEDRHAVHVGPFEGLGEGCRIKIRGDIGDEGRGVKVEMDLALVRRQRMGRHSSRLPVKAGKEYG